ncbi:LysR substrate-binding domain-containing protein, partial [Acinetobacter baumannii]
MACLPALGLGLMPRIIAALRKDFPDVLVRFEIGSSVQVRDQVARGQCDIGFAADEVELEGLTATPIVTTNAVVA